MGALACQGVDRKKVRALALVDQVPGTRLELQQVQSIRRLSLHETSIQSIPYNGRVAS